MLNLETCKKHLGKYVYMSMVTMMQEVPIPNVKEVRKLLDVNEAEKAVILGPGILLHGSNVIKVGEGEQTYIAPEMLLGDLVSSKTVEAIDEYIKNIDYFVGGEVL